MKGEVPATFVSRLTARGRGAIATVAVSGPAAVSYVEDCFQPLGRRPFSAAAVGRIVYGRWLPSDGIDSNDAVDLPSQARSVTPLGEELVVCQVAPHVVEIHCHGGEAAVRTIVNSLVKRGCQELEWRRATVADAPGRMEREAMAALSQASTLRTATVLLAQYHGALRGAVQAVVLNLQQDEIAEAQASVARLLGWQEFGLHLTKPWQVTLTGAPNVGKSSLINALLGYDRTVVYDQPGTTRDVVTAQTAFGGWPVCLADTAGLRVTAEPLEVAGVKRAERQIRECDLLVVVVDARDLSVTPPATASPLHSRRLVVANKVDLLSASQLRVRDVDCCDHWTSAITQAGIEELAEGIATTLLPAVPGWGEAVPFDERHVDGLHLIDAALRGGQREDALHALLALLAD